MIILEYLSSSICCLMLYSIDLYAQINELEIYRLITITDSIY